jgi:hypothetical protein
MDGVVVAAGATGVAGVSGRTGGATTEGAGATAGLSAGTITGLEGAAAGGAAGATGATDAGGAAGLAAGGTTTGLATTGGATGRAAAGAAASFFCVMALSTSPGREMCDKSILVLISSSPRSVRADLAAGVCASLEARRWRRTFSASCSSKELECVFFSVTPTTGNTSRMALLLTSSSLARSLIRTLLIRPFLRPALCLGLHRSLTESASWTRTPSKIRLRVP